MIGQKKSEEKKPEEFQAREVKDRCVAWIREFFDKNGKDCNCIIGISGGKDSSVAAALCVEALGRERVFGVLMPNGRQADIDMAWKLVDFLGIGAVTIPIDPVVNAVICGVEPALMQIKRPPLTQGVEFVPVQGTNATWADSPEFLPEGGMSGQARINLPARIRMAVLYAVSQSKNGRVVNTCNLSEDWVGYSTRYGDSAGDFSPLSDLTVGEVKLIGRAVGIPEDLIEKVPSDGLCGKSDEDNLGFRYEVLDRYIRTGEIEDKAIKEKIDRLHEKNLFKLQLMPKFILEELYT